MPVTEVAILLAVGLFAGGYGIIIGVGGGFAMVPLLILAWGFSPALAVGTNLAVVFVTAISGSIAYSRSKTIDYRVGILLAVAEMPSAVLGAIAVKKVPEGLVQILFGIFLITIATYMALKHGKSADSQPARAGAEKRVLVTATGTRYEYSFRPLPAMALTAAFGAIASFFGIGGGLLRVPMLVSVFKFPVSVAAATSIFAMALSTGVGVISHACLGNIDCGAWCCLRA